MCCGLGYGVLLAASSGFPLRMLLEKTAPPKWVAYALLAAMFCVLLWLLLSGKLVTRDFPLVGWTAVGYSAFGIALAVLSRWVSADTADHSGLGALSGFVFLLAYMILFQVRQKP